jgi:integrase
MKKIKVQQYADGRWGFDDYSLGELHKVRLKAKEKAQSRAQDVAVLLANRRHDLLGIDARELAEFRAWKAACKVSLPVGEIIQKFLALKARKSSRHLQSLTSDLALFENFVGSAELLGAIPASTIQEFIDSRDAGDRRKFNLRACVIGLFSYARDMAYIIPDTTGRTEAEKTLKIEIRPGKANVLSATEIKTLLDNVREQYLPWLCIAGFAGIRSEEIAPDPNSKKSPLKWEDFKWEHKIIIVREETSKTKQAREVPISDNLAEWLASYRNATGPVLGASVQPTRSETKRLGELIGGWKHNALRDSYCSYRTRINDGNVPQTAYEMGNSVAQVKRSYHRLQSREAAVEWFSIRPSRAANVLSIAV